MSIWILREAGPVLSLAQYRLETKARSSELPSGLVDFEKSEWLKGVAPTAGHVSHPERSYSFPDHFTKRRGSRKPKNMNLSGRGTG